MGIEGEGFDDVALQVASVDPLRGDGLMGCKDGDDEERMSTIRQ